MAASRKRRVAVLISGRGSNMASLIEAAKAPDYPAEIALVISNRPDAEGLARAAAAGVNLAGNLGGDVVGFVSLRGIGRQPDGVALVVVRKEALLFAADVVLDQLVGDAEDGLR